jgi:hypothetical protein
VSDVFYTDLQGVVNDIMPQFKQGKVILRRVTRAADPSPSQVGEVTGVKDWELAAAVPKEVPKKFINGTTIVEGDLMVVSAVRAISPAEDISPQMGDVLLVDDVQKTIKAIKPAVKAGNIPVAFQIFIQG